MAGERAVVGIPGYAPLPGHRPAGCAFAPRCSLADDLSREQFPPVSELGDGHSVRCWHTEEAAREIPLTRALRRPRRPPARACSPSPASTPTTATTTCCTRSGSRSTAASASSLVGESGSGKTTLARCVAGLHKDYTGEVILGGEVLPEAARARSAQARKDIQYVFQNPYASLNPRRTVGQTIARQLELFFPGDRKQLETGGSTSAWSASRSAPARPTASRTSSRAASASASRSRGRWPPSPPCWSATR